MLYGTNQEHSALQSYQHLAPHEQLRDMGFAVWGSDGAHDWLAASPDGLITSPGLDGLTAAVQPPGCDGGAAVHAASAPAAAGLVSKEVAAWVRQQTGVCW